jgi:hypothetical protein
VNKFNETRERLARRTQGCRRDGTPQATGGLLREGLQDAGHHVGADRRIGGDQAGVVEHILAGGLALA